MPHHLSKLTFFTLIVLFLTGIASALVGYDIVSVAPAMIGNIIRIHVSWTVISLVVIGMVIEGHVRKMFKTKNRNKKNSGIVMLVLFSALVITSFILRHIKMPMVQEIAGITHMIVGIVVICAFSYHVLVKKST